MELVKSMCGAAVVGIVSRIMASEIATLLRGNAAAARSFPADELAWRSRQNATLDDGRQ